MADLAFAPIGSECQLRAQLDRAISSKRSRARAGHQAKAARIEVCHRIAELGRVRYAESVRAKFQAHSLLDGEPAKQRRIEVKQSRATERDARSRPQSVVGAFGKVAGFEPGRRNMVQYFEGSIEVGHLLIPRGV